MDVVRWIEHPRASLCAKQLFCHRVQGERSFAKVMLEKSCFLGEHLVLTGCPSNSFLKQALSAKRKREKWRYMFFFFCPLCMSGPVHCSSLKALTIEDPFLLRQSGWRQTVQEPRFGLGDSTLPPSTGPQSRNLLPPMKSRPLEMTSFWGKAPDGIPGDSEPILQSPGPEVTPAASPTCTLGGPGTGVRNNGLSLAHSVPVSSWWQFWV